MMPVDSVLCSVQRAKTPFAVWLTFVATACMAAEPPEAAPAPRVIRQQPGWPTVFELDVRQSYTLSRSVNGRTVTRTVRLVSVEHEWEPDCWTRDNPDRQTLARARIVLDVSGTRATLVHRPYQLPTTLNGLRLYVETTKQWATRCELAALVDVKRDVRLSAVAEGEGWGPDDMQFPIQDYRWRSSTYNNTWCALVPYNLLYYHRGEDLGAIPDRLPVVAMMGGTVEKSPLPSGDGRSNAVSIRSPSGVSVRYAHMNIENINRSLVEGKAVTAGQSLGKTGMTWSGRRSQTHDPHLHVGFGFNGTYLSTYPFFVDAYLRSYSDPLLPVAGGYRFALPGERLDLDGSRSVARPGDRIAAYTWRLHDGRVTNDARARITYEKPGLYSEELVVQTEAGAVAHDFAQVRVYDRHRGREMARGWIHHTPVRGIKPGMPVLFWNRLVGTVGPMTIDFGDGTPKQRARREVQHAFANSGQYVVTYHGTGPDEEPVTVKTCVVVEQ